MRITILIDNSPSREVPDMLYEHGFSMYFEVDGYKWLIDAGASDKFLTNAPRLGINVGEVDFLILSHAHADHTGGLAGFLASNTKAKVYLSPHITSDDAYYSVRRGAKRNISIDYSVVTRNNERCVRIDKSIKLTKSVSLLCMIPHPYPRPKGNKTLLNGNNLDDFSHEMAVVVDTSEGAVVISSCCHNGILNTLEASGKTRVAAFVGGTHLLDRSEEFEFETESELHEIAQSIRENYAGMKLITGHCTGKSAVSVFRESLQSNFKLFKTGDLYEFDDLI